MEKTVGRKCTKCGRALSQYNTTAVCGPCSRATENSGTPVATGIPDRAWRDPRAQQALALWDFGQLLLVLRRRSGMSQMALRSLTGLTQSFISDLERGHKELRGARAIIDLLNSLGLPADLRPLLLAPMSGTQRPVSVGIDPALPWTVDRMVTELEVAVGGSMNRRNVLALSGAGLMQYVLQSTIAPTEAAAAPSPADGQATDTLIDSLQATTDALRQLDATSGSGALLPAAKAHLNVVLKLVKSADGDRTRRRLAAVTADTAMQTGWYTFDSGAHTAGQRIFLGALRAAHASGDPRLTAGALAFLAIHAYSVGDPRDAVSAARAARQNISGQDAPALHAMLLTRQARGHARLREEREAQAALEEARALCGRSTGEHDPRWLYWINEGEVLGQMGSCWLDLGNPARAASTFDAARASLNTDEARTRAQFLSRAATAQRRAGNTDAGCAIGHEVIALAAGIRSARLDDHLQKMLSEFRQANPPALTRELLECGDALLGKREVA
ncbi:helix-turn-helix domain-containing protein [Streptomyces buecherae]|uniref:helix-turn-helix domain-containing protein n=1 Tax=Streptomyces buecherae TaxID=2763006 RepID=UPI003659E7C8